MPLPLEDSFPYDDSVELVLRPAAGGRVLVMGSPEPALQKALSVIKGVTVVEAAAGAAAAPAEADLVVSFDGPLPADWQGPAVVVMPAEAVGPITPLDEEVPGEWLVNKDHPLAEALYAGTPQIGKVRRYQLGPGAQILVGTPEAPLLVTWGDGGMRRLAVLFPLDEKTTDWPRRKGFPIFWSHAMDWLVPGERRPAEYVVLKDPTKVGGFIGSDEPFQSGPGRDDSEAAIRAIRASSAAHLRAAHTELWPLLAAAALALLLARGWVAR
jgi:hypothetical protein